MTHIEELKRIRSILSAVTGLEDDDDEYIGDARKAVEQLIDKLEAQPQQEQDGCPVCGSDVHDRDALDKAEREIERLRSLAAQPQRKPLTEDEIYELVRTMANGYKTTNWLCRAIEAAHGIKE